MEDVNDVREVGGGEEGETCGPKSRARDIDGVCVADVVCWFV